MIKKIRILGIDYPVTYVDMCGNVGQCHNLETKIVIDTAQNSEQHQPCVLLHEIIEALDYRLELKLDHNVLTSLESGLYQVFRDNPGLAKYIITGK